MKDMTVPYANFRRFVRSLDQIDALRTIWGYHRHIVDDHPLPQGHAAERPSSVNLREHLWPWTLDILSREVILHAGRHPRPDHRLAHFEDLRTAINSIRRLGDVDPGADIDVMLYMHRLAHQQLPWQSGGWNRASVTRAWKVFGDEVLDGMVRSRYGMSMRQVMWLGFATGGNFLSKWGMTTRTDYQNPLDIPLEASIAFFDTLARTPRQLRELAVRHQSLDDSWAFTWNPLRAHPLVRYDPQHPDYVLCPVPRFAQERITLGVFYDIVNEAGFSDAFGPAFQRYIGEVIESRCAAPRFEIRAEAEYHVGRHRKDGVDWTVRDDGGVLFVECKTKRMSFGAKDLTDPLQLERDLGELAKAIVQHYKNIDDVLAGRTPHPTPTGPVFMMVVTLESWHLMSGTVRRQLGGMVVERMQKAGVSLRMLEDIPWQVVAAQEFEQLVQVISDEGLTPVLREKTSPAYRDWDFVGFVLQTMPGWLASYAPLFPDDEAKLFPDWITQASGQRKVSGLPEPFIRAADRSS